ncbi:MAG: hypothetical protein PF436_11970 [Prolixibacteraceae bacterium]|jgi:hypothetical protein|nr:hypothetical protein [Prolixibacteraceae bacterium]
MKKYIILLLPVILIIAQLPAIAQTDTTIYRLTLRQEKVNKAGEEVTGITLTPCFRNRAEFMGRWLLLRGNKPYTICNIPLR